PPAGRTRRRRPAAVRARATVNDDYQTREAEMPEQRRIARCEECGEPRDGDEKRIGVFGPSRNEGERPMMPTDFDPTATTEPPAPVEPEVLTDLSDTDLVDEINEAHRAAGAAHMTGANKGNYCGRLLVEAKRRVGHGNFEQWIREN